MGWPPPKTLMGFQQVSEAEKHHATMNLSEPEPKHITCHQEAARAYHPPYTTPLPQSKTKYAVTPNIKLLFLKGRRFLQSTLPRLAWHEHHHNQTLVSLGATALPTSNQRLEGVGGELQYFG